MIRGASKRFSALFGAVFFLLSTTGEGFGFQPCPFHDALHGAEASGTVAGVADDGLDHSGHTSHEIDEGGGSHGHHSDHELCTHVGACQVAAGGLLPVQLDAITEIAFASGTVAAIPPVERVFVTFVPFFLPYANAPPANG